ncbi:SCO2524 family protein [Streptomyces sp. NPDC058739]|uniref:SCO2524 family protein n=1 Tax=Streptomyces sp. NPDC058739 TaxID=3346618 RepID=UPI0036C3A096
MQLKPRQQLLEIWQSIARHSFTDGAWEWGEEGGRSSVADAERLLCLLYPATEIAAFRLDDPDTTQDDVERALGPALELPDRLLDALDTFMRCHLTDDGPSFAGGDGFTRAHGTRGASAGDGGAQGESTGDGTHGEPAGDGEVPEWQRRTGVVDSYSMSLTLCLATLGFLKVYRSRARGTEALHRIDRLRQRTSDRLSAALVALLRSFTVNVIPMDSPQGQSLCRLLGGGRLSDRQVVQRFQRRFQRLRAVISESIFLGADIDEQLRSESRLFECGWSWSVVRHAPGVETSEAVGTQDEGVALPVPYLYFTVVALDGINDLFSERTLILGLLNPEQQRLAEALRLRWEITQQYWSAVARFGDGPWPLEEIPWRTTPEGTESEYFSLCAASLLVSDLVRRRPTDDDLVRTVAVMERLAERARITSRATDGDPALGLHHPGVSLPLLGSEALGPPLRWTTADFAPQLLKRTIQLAALSRDIASQARSLRLAENILDHLWARRVGAGAGEGLWDDVHAVHPESPPREGPVSWSVTERVTECMVAAHALYDQQPIRSAELATLARELLSEATHLFGREQMEQPAPHPGSSQAMTLREIEIGLRRARRLVDEQPGTAFATTLTALARLDELARARESVGRREG